MLLYVLQEFMRDELPWLAAGFSEPLQSMIGETRPSSLSAFNAIDKLPHSNNGDNGVVYIGDAWHPMSPFSGAAPCQHITLTNPSSSLLVADLWSAFCV